MEGSQRVLWSECVGLHSTKKVGCAQRNRSHVLLGLWDVASQLKGDVGGSGWREREGGKEGGDAGGRSVHMKRGATTRDEFEG